MRVRCGVICLIALLVALSDQDSNRETGASKQLAPGVPYTHLLTDLVSSKGGFKESKANWTALPYFFGAILLAKTFMALSYDADWLTCRNACNFASAPPVSIERAAIPAASSRLFAAPVTNSAAAALIKTRSRASSLRRPSRTS